MIDRVYVLQQGYKKCLGMGRKKHRPSKQHPLAPCICNYRDMIFVEMKKSIKDRDYVFILMCSYWIADFICRYTEKNTIKGDADAEGWLYYSKTLLNIVCDPNKLASNG